MKNRHPQTEKSVLPARAFVIPIIVIIAIFGVAHMMIDWIEASRNLASTIYWWAGLLSLLLVWAEMWTWAGPKWYKGFLIAMLMLSAAVLTGVAMNNNNLIGPKLSLLFNWPAKISLIILAIFGLLSMFTVRQESEKEIAEKNRQRRKHI